MSFNIKELARIRGIDRNMANHNQATVIPTIHTMCTVESVFIDREIY